MGLGNVLRPSDIGEKKKDKYRVIYREKRGENDAI